MAELIGEHLTEILTHSPSELDASVPRAKHGRFLLSAHVPYVRYSLPADVSPGVRVAYVTMLREPLWRHRSLYYYRTRLGAGVAGAAEELERRRADSRCGCFDGGLLESFENCLDLVCGRWMWGVGEWR